MTVGRSHAGILSQYFQTLQSGVGVPTVVMLRWQSLGTLSMGIGDQWAFERPFIGAEPSKYRPFVFSCQLDQPQ